MKAEQTQPARTGAHTAGQIGVEAPYTTDYLGQTYIVNGNGDRLAGPMRKAVAVELVRRYNSQPDLLEACKDVAAYLEAIQAIAAEIGEATAIKYKLGTLNAAIAKAQP